MSTNYKRDKHENVQMSIRLYIFIILSSLIFFPACAKKDIEPPEKIYTDNNKSIDANYAVVANKNMPELSFSQVKAIFLKKTIFINKLKIVPINLSPNDELRLKFEENILEMNFEMLKEYWAKQYNLGYRPPLTMKSEESIQAFLKKVDGSIGYIRIKNMDENLKIIYKWSD